MSGLGRRRKRVRRVGRGILSDIIGSLGLGRRRRRVGVRRRRVRRRTGGMRMLAGRRRRHTRRGRGFLDILKSAVPFIKNSGIVSHALSYIPRVGPIASGVAKSLGFGRRRRVRARGRARRGIRM
jgi:hypothetical protein